MDILGMLSIHIKDIFLIKQNKLWVEDTLKVKPSIRGFIRFYMESLTALFLYIGLLLLSKRFGGDPYLFMLIASIPLLVSLWVLRSKYTGLSLGFFIMISLGEALWNSNINQISFDPYSIYSWVEGMKSLPIPAYVKHGIIVSTILTPLTVELYRRTLEYQIGDEGIIIKGGTVRKQEVYYPYTQISNIVVEQSIIGRILNYGTIIPISTGGWGTETYTRMIGVIAKGSLIGGAGYGRSLQEASRDPSKSLYGINDPEKIAREIRERIGFNYKALKDQVSLLRDIRDTLKEKKK